MQAPGWKIGESQGQTACVGGERRDWWVLLKKCCFGQVKFVCLLDVRYYYSLLLLCPFRWLVCLCCWHRDQFCISRTDERSGLHSRKDVWLSLPKPWLHSRPARASLPIPGNAGAPETARETCACLLLSDRAVICPKAQSLGQSLVYLLVLENVLIMVIMQLIWLREASLKWCLRFPAFPLYAA